MKALNTKYDNNNWKTLQYKVKRWERAKPYHDEPFSVKKNDKSKFAQICVLYYKNNQCIIPKTNGKGCLISKFRELKKG